ncbi:alpha-2-macroglobulin family protein [Celeribacter baekdonensis]|uniref:alpha-2-macroglobulin family protein n=1 Tax=Celeribacter baekdonensis TaxID=875171 RepID=UPI003A8D263B
MRCLFSVLIVLLNLASPAFSQDPLPEKRLINTRNVDFYGADLQSIFDTTLESCERACLNDVQCNAFTFNARSGACFPKSAVSERTAYDGAISGEVITIPSSTRDLARARAGDLEFLAASDFEAARRQTQSLGATTLAGSWSVEDMLDAYFTRLDAGDMATALDWLGGAVARTDDPDLWQVYAARTVHLAEDETRKNNILRKSVMPTAINAYLRQADGGKRAEALVTLARALDVLDRGQDQLPPLRMAQSLAPSAEGARLLERAERLYGFQITDHTVDSDIALPRICAAFNRDLVRTGVDYGTYVGLEDATLAVTAQDRSLCIEGVEHGARYALTFRKGLPSESGEKLARDVTLDVYIRDRAPEISFPGRTYVLPRTPDAGLPVETVNVDQLDLRLRRISDRNLVAAIREDYFGRPLAYYEERYFSRDYAEDVWSGQGEVQNTLNKTMLTRLPLAGPLADLDPGIYVLSADLPDADPYDGTGATQWFVVSDLGLTSLSGTEGLHVYVRSLGNATPRDGVAVDLISRSNRVLGAAFTDQDGHAMFDAGLTRGTDGTAPAMLIARANAGTEAEDMVFLPLTDPAFDLSDRGVEGMPPAPPIDVFLATDRDAYRPGETVHVTALMRDTEVKSIPDLPLTAILTRPDGVEYSRTLSKGVRAGGHVFDLPLGTTVSRGTWRLDLRSDLEAPALASSSLLVEDFLPERIDFGLSLPDGPIRAGDTPPLTVEARYLFGAPGADLSVEGTVRLAKASGLEAWPGFLFGLYDDTASPVTRSFGDGLKTDAQGKAVVPLELPDVVEMTDPLMATITTRVAEGSGRPVERRLTHSLALSGPVIGIRPGFDGLVGEGDEARFAVIGLDAEAAATPMPLRWTVNRLERHYRWYQIDGSWDWDVSTTRKAVASGELMTGADPVALSAPVEWGEYELVVEQIDGTYAASSYAFSAGWYVPAGADSPDTLEMSLDRDSYTPGDTAKLRLMSRYDGTALIAVMSNHVIATQSVTVREGENMIPVPVTKAWGTGAYVTVQAIRPMDVSGGLNPARALGLVYAAIDPGARALSVSIEASDTVDPRGPLPTVVHVEGAEGTAYVTLAAVDLGVLNLTGFDSPDPIAHYFGQRRLGVEIRDLYGRLIDGMNGAAGQIRSGGDASGGMQREAPPPTEDLVAYFSGPVEIGADGTAQISFDMPSFNGTVRLMAVAWSDTGVGAAERDVLVRDPVVVTASLPPFLAPGDTAQMLLEFVHTEGPAGDMALAVSAPGLTLGAGIPETLTLNEQSKLSLRVPVSATVPGDYEMTVSLTTPAGKVLTKDLRVPVRVNDPQISETRRFALQSGRRFTLNQDVFTAFRPGTGSALITAGPLARFDVPGLLRGLDLYPYGCTEQLTSRALPLLYFDEVARSIGMAKETDLDVRLAEAVRRILTRQDSNGAFGLWQPGNGDFWLDAYVSDFLSRARAQGVEVPDVAFRAAMDNLRNQISYASDFEVDRNGGGVALAYALMVLAREGAARVGDLRYYADEKSADFATPLAQAQLGAALAYYGDQPRADRLFARAASTVSQQATRPDPAVWRDDYGSTLRDAAGIISLAAEAGSTAVDLNALVRLISNPERGRSTQEMTWSLLAAHDVLSDPNTTGLSVDGANVNGAFVRLLEDQTEMSPITLTNTASTDTDLTLTTFGVPSGPVQASGYGFAITRSYYTPEGVSVSGAVPQGTRLVVVLDIAPSEAQGGRLMIDDPLPAGLEIDNPHLISSGDMSDMEWLETAYVEHAEFRSDRFLAQVNRTDAKRFQLAYVVRAITPGTYHQPAASVEDMYRPQYMAHTASGRFIVTE